jgi:hypothetical protein
LPENFSIPETVTAMECTFMNCYKLQNNITINANPATYNKCFANAGSETTEGITISGTSSMLNELVATKSSKGKVTIQ